MSFPLFIVDAFTDKPFAGNPAAVCLLADPDRDTEWMQSVAAEMNLSETAFVQTQGTGFHLRWFTPKTEVSLCGHATLASAHVLCEEGIVPLGQPMTFHTLSGPLQVVHQGDQIEMDFPAVRATKCAPPAGLGEALGCELDWVGRNEMDYLGQVSREQVLRQVQPRFEDLAKVEMRGLILTATSDSPEMDFVSRFFAPAVGVNEDPVTGSAHCALAPFWSERLDRQKLIGYQASTRGGFVVVELQGDRVLLGGQAVTITKGTLLA